MGVPDQSNIKLSEVITELSLSTPTGLLNCFANATDANFDPTYKGDKDRLSNFRNYRSDQDVSVNVNATNLGAIGKVGNIGGTWTSVRDATSGSTNFVSPHECWVDGSARYTVWRWFLTFDLSALPTNGICTDAIMWFKQNTLFGSSGFGAYAMHSTHSNPLVSTDFDNFSFSNYAMNEGSGYSWNAGCSQYDRWVRATDAQCLTIDSYFGGDLKLVMLNYTHDILNSAPSSKKGFDGVNGVPVGDCYRAPVLELTYH